MTRRRLRFALAASAYSRAVHPARGRTLGFAKAVVRGVFLCVAGAWLAVSCSEAPEEARGGASRTSELAATVEPEPVFVPEERAKNVILISIDTLRADHLGSYGYSRDTSPGLDELARKGTLFLNCTSSSAWTVPAHLTIFTSLEPATHGCVYYDHRRKLNAGYDTMASILASNGFRTGAFTGGGFMSPAYGADIGFETFDSGGMRFRDNETAVTLWLDEVGDAPFFLFWHGYDVHFPYWPPKPFRDQFRKPPVVASADAEQRVAPKRKWRARSDASRPWVPKRKRRWQERMEMSEFNHLNPPDADQLEFMISQYDGEIAYVDDQLTRFFRQLERSGQLEETLVVITSDHGEEFFEHGRRDHIHSLYDELVSVPWIMFGPGVPAGEVAEHVGTIDILPTMLDLLGIRGDYGFQGRSRVGALPGVSVASSASDEEDYVFSFTGSKNPKHLSSLRSDRWKLIVDRPGVSRNDFCWRCRAGMTEGESIQLFDLLEDPLEQNNLAEKRVDVVRELYAHLDAKIAECRSIMRATEEPDPATQEQLEALKALGYLDR